MKMHDNEDYQSRSQPRQSKRQSSVQRQQVYDRNGREWNRVAQSDYRIGQIDRWIKVIHPNTFCMRIFDLISPFPETNHYFDMSWLEKFPFVSEKSAFLRQLHVANNPS
jgi:hypothetical protein